MFFYGQAYEPPMSEDERRVSRWLQEAKAEALKIQKADGRVNVSLTVQACPWGVVVAGNLAGAKRRMELSWLHIQHRGESPIRDTVRNIASVLGLRKAG